MNTKPSRYREYVSAYLSQGEPLDSAQRDELILTYTPLIKYIASRLSARLPPQVSVDDLISCGIVGLIDAINKYEPAKKVLFKTYAEFRIKGAMLDELRSLDWVPRSVRRKVSELEKIGAELEIKLGRPPEDEELSEAMGLSLDEFYRLLDETKSVTFMDVDHLRQSVAENIEGEVSDVLAADDKDPFAVLNLGQTRDLLAQAIGELPEKEKLAVALYYKEELTMKEIGEVLGCTESRISQMHSKAMLRLRTKLKKHLDA